MAIRELVDSIQSIFPPAGQIPPADSGQPRPSEAEGLPPDLEPISRHPQPDWIEPGEAIPLPGDGIIAIEGAMPEAPQGPPAPIDVLAYYLPFHFYDNGRWGVYLRASGVVAVASMLASASGRTLSQDLLSIANAILLQHERFHFLSEIACSRAELVTEYELYRHYFHDRGATAVEEALCNAHAFRTALRRQPTTIRRQVKQWMQAQGPGYRDFEQCLSASTFLRWQRIAAQRMQGSARGIELRSNGIRAGGKTRLRVHHSWAQIGPRSQPMPTEFLFAGLARAAAPTYLVGDVPGVGVLRPFPKYEGLRVLVHTNDHPPPHIHVEIPPGRDFTRLEWPALQPLPGDPELSGKQRKSLDKHVSKYSDQIDQKIRRVYGAAA